MFWLNNRIRAVRKKKIHHGGHRVSQSLSLQILFSSVFFRATPWFFLKCSNRFAVLIRARDRSGILLTPQAAKDTSG
jgi:hypothetical protein